MDQNITKPLVSVIITTYNRADMIVMAIESVLSQTYPNWELIIADDASTDDTFELLKYYRNDPRIRYVRNEINLGIAANRNEAIRHSKGMYIAMLDSDDKWIDPDKLSKQVEFMEKNPHHGIVGTFMTTCDPKNIHRNISYETNDKHIRERMLLRCQFVQSSILIRRTAIDEVGLYDEAMSPVEDYELWLRIGTRYSLANIPIFSVLYTIHNNNSYQNINHVQNLITRVLRRYKELYPYYYLARLKNVLRLYYMKAKRFHSR